MSSEAGPGAGRERRIGRLLRSGDGITIVESAIAVALMALIAAWAASTISGTGRALGESQAEEQATQLALEAIEWSRGLTWEQLTMSAGTESGDPNIDPYARTLVGYRFGIPTNEPLVEGGTDPLVPPLVEETLGTTAFQVRSYVTEAGAGLRRIAVEVTWEVAGSPRRHIAATLISEVSAG